MVLPPTPQKRSIRVVILAGTEWVRWVAILLEVGQLGKGLDGGM